ncbi:MAG: hypothetical protein WD690_13515 [Vicinamibacterales bacterium]
MRIRHDRVNGRGDRLAIADVADQRLHLGALRSQLRQGAIERLLVLGDQREPGAFASKLPGDDEAQSP